MAKGKRTAGTDLNHDNWNDEEESEDAGEFRKASNEILQQRVRKIAKRRGVEEGGNGKPASNNPFGGFGGFGATPALNPSPFGFLAKMPSSTITSMPANTTTPVSTTKTNGESKTNALGKSDNNTEFLGKVKALNVAFVNWTKRHIDEDSLCDLTPVFKDYEKYMRDFELLKTKKQTTEPPKNDSTSSFTFGKPASTNNSSPQPSINVFASKPAASPVKTSLLPALAPTESKGFSMGLSTAAPNTQSTAAPFSFGLQKTSTMNSSAIFGGFSAAPAFSFGNVTQNKTETPKVATDGATGEGAEEESDEPPKNEFKPVVEEDSLYSKRCKVFVKTGADYSDRGVGTVFLKKVEDKLQMIVRADTNLGNILLNIIISGGLPVSRMGKNNVMVVCIPTPDSKPPPVSVLIRVKTGEEADNLLATIEKHKKE